MDSGVFVGIDQGGTTTTSLVYDPERGKVSSHSVPITADAVDAHAALFAQGCWDNTTVKATLGTGAIIEANTGVSPVEPEGNLPVFIAWDLTGQVDYTVEGSVFAVGSAIDWVVRSGLLPSAAESAGLAESVNNSGGVMMVPSFTGLSAPYWKSNARAAITGLGLDTKPGHIARASKPCSSKLSTAAWVVPPGLVTRRRNSSRSTSPSAAMRQAPRPVCMASCRLVSASSPSFSPALVMASINRKK